MHPISVAELCEWRSGPIACSGDPPPADSVIRAGFVPPLPFERTAEGPLLLWGRALVRRAAHLGVRELRVLPAPPAAREALLLALRLEARAGRYSWEERDEIVSFSEQRGVVVDGELSRLVSGDAGLAETIAQYRSLAAGRRRAVNSGAVDLRTALRLGVLPDDALQPLCEARLSFSTRRQLLVMLSEIVERDGVSAEDAGALARRVAESDDPLGTARAIRMPRLSAMERRVTEMEAGLREVAPVRLAPPPGFEGGGFDFSVRLSAPRDVSRAIDALARLREEADEFFDLL